MRRIDLSKARRGQGLAVQKIVDNVRHGRLVTPIVLPTRYGKSDAMRLQAYHLQGAGLVFTSVILTPNKIIQHQMVDKKKIREMNKRYNLESYRYQTVDEVKYGRASNGQIFFDIASNDETFSVMTIQLALYYKRELMVWLDHILHTVGLPIALFVDETHFLSEDNIWGNFAKDWVKMGGVLCCHTATPERFDGLDIPGIPTNTKILEEIWVKRYRKHQNPEKYWVDIYDGQKIIKTLDEEYLEKYGVFISFKEAWASKDTIICHCQRVAKDFDLREIGIRDNEVKKLSELSEQKTRQYLGRVVRDKLVIKTMMKEAIEILGRLKKLTPNVAMIIFSANDYQGQIGSNKHAKSIYSATKSIDPKIKSVIVTSTSDNDDKPSRKINGFRDSNDDCLIVKQMAGCGSDIPRAKLIVDLSPNRSGSAYIQRLMRGGTPFEQHKVFVYLTVDDIIGKALFKKWVENEGGSDAHIVTGSLIVSNEKDKGENLTDSKEFLIESGFDGDLIDTKKGVDEAWKKKFATGLMDRFPGIALTNTWNDAIRFAEEVGVDPSYFEEDSEPEDTADLIKEEQDKCGILARQIATAIIGGYTPEKQKLFAKQIKNVWYRAKKSAFIPSFYYNLPISKINDLDILEKIKESLIRMNQEVQEGIFDEN